MTISTSGGLGLLRMVLEPGIGRCASEDVEHRSRVDISWCASEDVGSQGGWTSDSVPVRILGPQGRWIVRSHIGWRGERNIPYKGVETSP